MNQGKRFKGLYIVSEPACMNSGTGARTHIDVGLQELGKYFQMNLVILCDMPAPAVVSASSPRRHIRQSWLWRLIKWSYILLRNHKRFFRYFQSIKRAAPNFIYERASYLNYNGLLIAKLLRIPHLYEVNGILADDNAEYYPAPCNKVSRWVERLAFNSTYGFYVGGSSEEIGVGRNRSEVIQNGIEKDFISHFDNRTNIVKEFIEIVFIGHAMKHHKLEIIFDALALVKKPSSFRLHLVGSNFQDYRDLMRSGIEVVEYGSLSHQQIRAMISRINVAVIPYSKDYFSHVKLFMYAAAKLAVLLPHTRNYDRLFNSNEVVFVANGQAADIARSLDHLELDRELIPAYGERLFNTVKRFYTWEEIYKKVAFSIQGKALKQGSPQSVLYESSACS